MERFHDVIHDLRQPTRDLRGAIPDVWAGFSEMHQAVMTDGALPGRMKELIALAIAAANGCDGCIAYHARGSAIRGATESEVAEALGVALLMAGGPASVEAPRAFEAFREFRAALVPSGVG
jgi:AhpD family alkylhydroperoxidase